MPLFDRPTRPRIWCRSLRPKWCAWLMMIVFAFGISRPDSMIVVETNTSNSPSMKEVLLPTAPPSTGHAPTQPGHPDEFPDHFNARS